MNCAAGSKVCTALRRSVELGLVLTTIAVRGDEQEELRARVAAAAAGFPELRWEPPREQDNGWRLLVEARDRIEGARPADLQNQHIPHISEDELAKPVDPSLLAKLKKWVAGSDGVMGLYDRALVKPFLVVDPIKPGSGLLANSIWPYSRARVVVLLSENLPDDAVRETVRIASTSHRFVEAGNDSSDKLMGLLFHTVMLSQTRSLVCVHPSAANSLPVEMLRLKPAQPVAEYLRTINRHNFTTTVNSRLEPVHQRLKEHPSIKTNPNQYDPVQTVFALGRYMEEQVQLASAPDPFATLRAFDSNIREREMLPTDEWFMANFASTAPPIQSEVSGSTANFSFAQTNTVSRLAALNLMPGPEIVENYYDHLGRVWAFQIELAALIHRSRSGRWPESHADLVGAGLLREIPPDPVTGEKISLHLKTNSSPYGHGVIRDTNGRVMVKREVDATPIHLEQYGVSALGSWSLPIAETEKRFQALELKTRK